MRARRRTFEGVLVQRRARLFIKPATRASRHLVDHLSFADGSELSAAIQSLIRRLGFSTARPAVKQDNPYAVVTGKKSLGSAKGRAVRMRPLGQEKRCFVCNLSGDGGFTCYEVKCKERADS